MNVSLKLEKEGKIEGDFCCITDLLFIQILSESVRFCPEVSAKFRPLDLILSYFFCEKSIDISILKSWSDRQIQIFSDIHSDFVSDHSGRSVIT